MKKNDDLRDYKIKARKFASVSERTMKTLKHLSHEPVSRNLCGIRNIDELFSSCDNLHKDINSVNTELKHLSGKKQNDVISDNLTQKIRNDFYLDGIRRIESRLKKKKTSQVPESVQTLTELLKKKKTVVELGDMLGEKAMKYLSDNKRQFGSQVKIGFNVSNKSKRSKNKEIVINPSQTVYQDLMTEVLVLNNKNKSLTLTEKKSPSPELKLPKIDRK